jgi:hypothetical protein
MNNEGLNILVDIMKFVIPSVLIFIIVYTLVGKFLGQQMDKMRMEYRMQMKSDLIPIKLQAYERVVLFLERISLQFLIKSHNTKDISATALKSLMIGVINQEYNHNLSQQIYISGQGWTMVKIVKEEVIAVINIAYSNLNEGATGIDLSKLIVERLMETEEQPTQKGINFLKSEVQLFFG